MQASIASRLSVNEFMWPDSSFEDDLETCRRAGIRGIGIWEDKLGNGRDEELIELFGQSGLQATVCAPTAPTILPSSFFPGPSDPQERIEQLVASIHRFKPFAPAQFVTITGTDDSLSKSEQRKIVVDGYRRAGVAAAEIGAVIGIEPIRLADESIITTVAEAADLVAEIGLESVGIIWDVWHHWDSPTVLEDIKSYAHLFTVVQLGDWPDRPHATDRAIPGEGVIPLDRMFGALESAGYTGWYDLEVLSEPPADDSVPKIDNDEMLRRCRRGVEAAWSKAGK
ncbi:sugar phosphate isomerase/epimerase family protein [Amycolatopsis pithecellobii]|uniref:TIM barrel protein n=1 Tax=Amycolatopsis pithecellobii TaxID=664692 RepID=A0A6N7ZAW5_9PSEU|nr:sugar phosphate isomerase/epimerase [Amycolatopsis pithecellobii]MTD58906.1 TIM barrel protein [Amycolatopsis pithecellobii]